MHPSCDCSLNEPPLRLSTCRITVQELIRALDSAKGHGNWCTRQRSNIQYCLQLLPWSLTGTLCTESSSLRQRETDTLASAQATRLQR